MERRIPYPVQHEIVARPNIPPAGRAGIGTYVASVLWWISIYLGLLLWFFYATDYSLPGTVSDLVFPAVVSLSGMLAICTAGALSNERRQRHWLRIACLPSLLGGLSWVLLFCVLFVPPLTLGGLFILDSWKSETLTQQLKSPNGLLRAEVYIRPGGYSGSYNKPIYVRITSTVFPLIERDVFAKSSHLEDAAAHNYVSWENNWAIRISETGETVNLGIVRPQMSVLFVFALCVTTIGILLALLVIRQRRFLPDNPG